jgi:hypothetical protein
MKVDYLEECGYTVMSDAGCECNTFPSVDALENHIKLMLIAVQQYKEKQIG